MSFEDEFAVVDMIVASAHETRGVDAFALSLIKAERQMRKLFTHLVFQCPCFDAESASVMRDALGSKSVYYFEGFERGFDALAPKTVATMVGADYAALRGVLTNAVEIRNKIFHGQLTQNQYVRRGELLGFVADIRRWCELLADAALSEVGYDGFQRNSFRKGRPNVANIYRFQITDIEGYKRLLAEYVARPRNGNWKSPV
jgi:hypothetical protein